MGDDGSTRVSAQFLAGLQTLLPADAVSLDPADLVAYGRDWTRVFPPAPCAVAFPRSTAEVAAIVRLCGRCGVPIVPSGGRTGLAGGAVAMHGELVLSLQRMRRIDPVDTLGQTMRVQAGAVTQDVHDHAAACGLTWPIDLAAKGSSQIGGNLATNAGGVKVLRYGHARNWVLGLQVVTAAGEVLETGRALEKDNTGLDLRQLFIGSEGTLGIITEATLKLARLPGHIDVLLFGLPDLAGALALFADARRAAPGVLHAFEFFTEFCMRHVVGHRGVPWPLASRPACYTLVEIEAPHEASLEAWLTGLFERGLVLDGVRAQSSRQARELWSYREGITESLGARGAPHKNDVALPLAGLQAFCADLEATWHVGREDWPLGLFGHVGDGNLHINALQPEGMTRETFRAQTAAADLALFALVQKHGGTISAEHGVGLVKKPYLAFARTAAEIAVQKAVKRALDPANLLNPGKIFDL